MIHYPILIIAWFMVSVGLGLLIGGLYLHFLNYKAPNWATVEVTTLMCIIGAGIAIYAILITLSSVQGGNFQEIIERCRMWVGDVR
jgi:hypothetical protein